MSPRVLFGVLPLVALAGASVGCSSTSTCNRDEDVIHVYGYVSADRTVFSSVEPAGLNADGSTLSSEELEKLPPYTYFPANRIVVFHVGLLDTPSAINVALSFFPERNHTVAPGAGNQALIRSYNKDEIVLRNDTCTEFWVWVTASTSAMPFHQVTDAGAEGGASGVDSTETAGAPGEP